MHPKQTLCKSAESPLRSLVDWINCSCSVPPTNAPANLPHSCGPHVATLTPRTSSSGASTRMNIWDRPAGQLWLWSYGIGSHERQVHNIVGIVVTSIVKRLHPNPTLQTLGLMSYRDVFSVITSSLRVMLIDRPEDYDDEINLDSTQYSQTSCERACKVCSLKRKWLSSGLWYDTPDSWISWSRYFNTLVLKIWENLCVCG